MAKCQIYREKIHIISVINWAIVFSAENYAKIKIATLTYFRSRSRALLAKMANVVIFIWVIFYASKTIAQFILEHLYFLKWNGDVFAIDFSDFVVGVVLVGGD